MFSVWFFHKFNLTYSLELDYSKNYLDFTKKIILTNKDVGKSNGVAFLTKGLSSNFLGLRSANHVKFAKNDVCIET